MIAIDLGSNTIRFIEYEADVWGRSFEKIVKTAESIHLTGTIGENALNRIINAIEEAKTHLDFTHHCVVGYTTAAMRMARNAEAVLDAIEAKTGIRFEVIDAKREADLTLMAVRYRLQKLGIEPSSFVMADIGGGSTELITYHEGNADSLSLNIGIVTLSEASDTHDTLMEKIGTFQQDVRRSIVPPQDSTLVLTAGTPTTISAYLLGMDYESYDPDRINGYILHRDECFRAYDELMGMEESLRTAYVGVGRERLIGAGILMVTAIYDALGYREAVIIDDGLREGIALGYYAI